MSGPQTVLEYARDEISQAACEWIQSTVSGGEDSAIRRFDNAVNDFEKAVREDERSTISVLPHGKAKGETA